MTNNPLHSLIYSQLKQWRKVYVSSTTPEIEGQIDIISSGIVYNDDLKNHMKEALDDRHKLLSKLLVGTVELQMRLDESMKRAIVPIPECHMCSVCGNLTERTQRGTKTYVCIDCSH